MKRTMSKTLLQSIATIFMVFGLLNSAAAHDDIATQVTKILKNNCGACHDGSDDGGIDYITDLEMLINRKKIIAGDLGKSRIWKRINDADDPMPPEGEEPRPTPEEISLIEEFIKNPVLTSVVASKDQPRETKVNTETAIAAIHEYLSELDDEDRPFQRFFVLNHLHNLPLKTKENPRGVSNGYLDLVRAGVSKTLNSLTWAPSIVTPQIVGAEKTVMAFDLRDVEWDQSRELGRPDLWKILVEDYPYGLKHQSYPDHQSTQSRAREIYQWTGVDIPWVRADWFVATATQPHLYHALLYDSVHESLRMRAPKQVEHADGATRVEQPMNASDLYEWLRVDVPGNLRRGRAARAAFIKSGVSSQNRMIERHPALFGYVWPSYDFKKGGDRMNLAAQPLGPDGFFNSEYERYSFDHDGGEMIFGLPNGMHGFLLVDGKGDRIPFGPPDVVFDKTKTTGNGMIVNGLSCIACHKNGLIENFKDEIRIGADGFPSSARKQIRKIFLGRPELDVLIAKDQSRYQTAALEAIKPYLNQTKIRAMENGEGLTDPVDPVATRFLGITLDAVNVAAELGLGVEEFRAAVKYNEDLKQLGLTVVANGGTINREIWESRTGLSVYQKAARTLKLGTPATVTAPPWRNR